MHQLRSRAVLADAENRLTRGMQRLQHHRQKLAPQLANDRHIKHIHREPRPQVAAEHGERGDVAFHLPAGSGAARKIDFVGDDQYGRCFHLHCPLCREPGDSVYAC